MSQELDPLKSAQATEKLNIGKQKKDAGDQAFKAQDIKAALRSYHEALMYLEGLEKRALPGIAPLPLPSSSSEPDQNNKQTRTDADEMIEKIYSNMSACHVKSGNWKRALDTATKALQSNPHNYKAQFRKGKAQAELGYIEKAEATLAELKTKNPADAATIEAELSKIRAQDAERERKHKEKFRGFLSRDKPTPSSNLDPQPVPATNGIKAKSSIPPKPTSEEDGDGTSSSQPILVPSGIEEVEDE